MVLFRAAFACVFLHVFISMRLVARLFFLGLLTAPAVYAETVTYQHDNNRNITQRTTIFGTTTYTYDPLNRLISEAGPAKTQSFTYDANGNRLSDGAGSYTYETGSNRMLTRRGLPVTTDALGNITADGTGKEYISNQAGQLAQVKQGGVLIATYEYDTDGLRLSKTTTTSAPQGAQTVVYHYDLDGKLIAETTATGSPLRAYIWLADTPVSQIEYVPSRKVYHFNVDHLNTPRAMMDDTGKVVWRWESDAFGSTLPNEDPDGDGVKMTSNLRFPGQYYDQETGLHYNWHRYYDPTMGQYTQPDPKGLAAGINLYTYVGGNPITRADPSGLDFREQLEDALGVGIPASMKARDAADQAMAEAQKSGLSGMHNGAADAYRHCVWSCLMTQSVGGSAAKVVGDNHEAAGNRVGQPRNEEQMDKANNEQGRQCAQQKDNKNCMQRCMDKVKNGQLFGLEGKLLK